jgi:hypothetical protein
MSNSARAKLIKDTIKSSIVTQISDELKSKLSDDTRRKHLVLITETKLNAILNSIPDEEILPSASIQSEEQFKAHLVKTIELVKIKLMNDIQTDLYES